MQLVNKYAIFIKYEKIVSYFVVLPVFYLLGILCYYQLNATLSLWIFLVVVFISATAVVYWAYKKIYDSNIQSIKKSLEELEELKEECGSV
jgi:F0F1-type ATP synthase membrane subunit b/b'